MRSAGQGRHVMTMQVKHAGTRRRRIAAPTTGQGQAHALPSMSLPSAQKTTTLGAQVPEGPQANPEYDPFEAGDFAQGIALGTAAEFLGPVVAQRLGQWLPPSRYPWLGSTYGKVAFGKSVGVATATIADAMSQPVAWGVRAALHGAFPRIAADPGHFKVALPPANALAGRWAKKVLTGMGTVWLKDVLRPEPPKPLAPPKLPSDSPADARVVSGWLIVDPAKGVGPDWAPSTAAPQILPPAKPVKPGPQFNGHDVRQAASDAVQGTAVDMLVKAAYDQVVGPVVQKTINTVMGRGDEPIRKPVPVTPGAFVNAVGSAFLGTLLLKPVVWKGPGTGMGPAIATSLVNGLIANAIDSVYSRGLGGAIEDAVNGVVGLPTSGRKPETFGAERVLRTVARGAASTGAAFWLEGISQAFFQGLATQLGGPIGAFVGMAGPTMAGLMGGTVVDALVGAQIGRLTGTMYSWITGKPRAEDRPVTAGTDADAAAPASAPAVTSGTPAPAAPSTAPQGAVPASIVQARRKSRAQARRMQVAIMAAH